MGGGETAVDGLICWDEDGACFDGQGQPLNWEAFAKGKPDKDMHPFYLPKNPSWAMRGNMDWSVNVGQHRVNELFEQMLTRCDAIIVEVQAMREAVRQMQAHRIKHNVDRVLFPKGFR